MPKRTNVGFSVRHSAAMDGFSVQLKTTKVL